MKGPGDNGERERKCNELNLSTLFNYNFLKMLPYYLFIYLSNHILKMNCVFRSIFEMRLVNVHERRH